MRNARGLIDRFGHSPADVYSAISLVPLMSGLASLFEPPADATADELRMRLRALADLIAHAPVPIAVAHDPDCRFISANDALARLLHLPTNVNISLTPPAGEQPLYRIQRHGRDLPDHELPMQYAVAHRT